jgi:hypothetical protein
MKKVLQNIIKPKISAEIINELFVFLREKRESSKNYNLFDKKEKT